MFLSFNYVSLFRFYYYYYYLLEIHVLKIVYEHLFVIHGIVLWKLGTVLRILDFSFALIIFNYLHIPQYILEILNKFIPNVYKY